MDSQKQLGIASNNHKQQETRRNNIEQHGTIRKQTETTRNNENLRTTNQQTIKNKLKTTRNKEKHRT